MTKMHTKLFSDSFHEKMLNQKESDFLHMLSNLQMDDVNSSIARAYHLRKNGMVSMLPAGKEPVYDQDGRWTDKNRQELKIGRALRQIANDGGMSATDSEIEQATHVLISMSKPKGQKEEFRLISGKEIHDWYQHTVQSGNCMTGKSAEILKFYIQNPKVVQLVVLVDGKTLLGRAILWMDTEQGTIMDRIYAVNDTVVNKFKAYARENGWAHKIIQQRGNSEFMYPPYTKPKGDVKGIHIQATTEFRLFPYLDTMCYVYDWGVSSIGPQTEKAKAGDKMPLSRSSYIGTATGTDGNLKDRRERCAGCGETFRSESLATINDMRYCGLHFGQCCITGKRVLNGDLVALANGQLATRGLSQIIELEGKLYNSQDQSQVIKYKEQWYRAEDCVFDHFTQKSIPKTEGIFIRDLNCWLRKDTYVEDMASFGFKIYNGLWMNEKLIALEEAKKKKQETETEKKPKSSKKKKINEAAPKTREELNRLADVEFEGYEYEPEDNDPPY